jgi:transposase
LGQEIHLAKKRFKRSEANVVSCYEAGRDGFWLDRYLKAKGIENLVVDSASIEVNRRARRAKTDRLDVGNLLGLLMRYDNGERKVWKAIEVPSEQAEDNRHLHRELRDLKVERTRHINRIKGFLAGQGIAMDVNESFLERVKTVRLWDGACLREGLRSRVEREYQRIQLINQQIEQLEIKRQELLKQSTDDSVEVARQLLRLRAIGIESAWLYAMEFFGWRKFRNRKEVGALSGLTPTPYQSGDSHKEQGISKAGNRYIRGVAIEMAWCWLRFQPKSKLSLWYQERFGAGNARIRRIGIVALARKLLVELWRYLETGALPEGAELKPA